MTPEALEKELSDARKYTLTCCSLPPRIKYEPGCSYIKCIKCGRTAARPDWGFKEVIKDWNGRHSTRENQ